LYRKSGNSPFSTAYFGWKTGVILKSRLPVTVEQEHVFYLGRKAGLILKDHVVKLLLPLESDIPPAEKPESH
jgi:hypothetical protein